MKWKPSTYYINLEKSEKRLNDMKKELRRFDLSAKRINAYDGRNAASFAKFQIRKSWKCYFTSDIEYAVTLSHLLAIATAYQNDDDVALILEDDMRILRLPTSKLIRSAPIDWEVLQLSVTGRKAIRLYQGAYEYFTKWEPAFTHMGAYMINRRGMIKLLFAMAPDILRHRDLLSITFQKADFRITPVPFISSCVADYIIYRLLKTYAIGDISMVEDRYHRSTIIPHIKYVPGQDDTAQAVISLFVNRGFLMTW